jgi:predicted HAD superfamily Cof-like phosphohydrolase
VVEVSDAVSTPFDPFAAVLEFHRTLGVRVGGRPEVPDHSTVQLRLRLIREELDELEQAVSASDIVEAADALADILYVVYGTAISFGVDVRPVFEEVHRSNMTKAGGPTRDDGKVLKPDGWQPPAIGAILAAQPHLPEVG